MAMRPCAERIPAARDASSAASGKKYMSLKQVIPPRSISAQARSVPSRTKSRDICRVSAGQTCSCSQRMSGRSSASPRISVMAACVWALTRPGIRTWPARSMGSCSWNRARASRAGRIASMRPSRIATAWPSSTLPAGWTGTTQRGRRSEPLAMKKGPGSAGASRASIVARLSARALHLDFHAAIRRQALDDRLAALLVGAGLHRHRLAVAVGLDLRAVEAPGNQVVAHCLGAALRQPLVVLRPPEAVGMPVDVDDADIGIVLLDAIHHFLFELRAAGRSQRCAIEREQLRRTE